MDKDKALKLEQVLEALENPYGLDECNRSITDNAITAIKQALAAQQEHEPENEPDVSLASVQEPVAWRIKVETKLRDGSVDVGYQLRNEKLSVYDEPLYITPPAQPAPVQEPVDGTQVSKVWWDGEKLMAKPIPLEDIYQPVDWKAEYLKSVESGCITLDELREARAELDATNRQVEILSDALAESQRQRQSAQRQWVGLTDDERLEVAEIDGADEWFWKVCKAIEAKLKEKNT
jgi:hypothetical protein